MSHARTQIRNAFRQLLDKADNWKAVIETRVMPTRHAFPFVLIYCDSEPMVNTLVQNPNLQERTLSVIVAAFSKVPADAQIAEDEMDIISVELEKKLTEDALRSELGGTANIAMQLQSQSLTIITDDEDTISHAEIELSYTVKYYTVEGQPETLV